MPKPPFPHMMPGDVPLFAAFVLSPESADYHKWEFDTHLGEGHITGLEFSLPILQLSLEVSRLRVDAIGWRFNHPTVFEVKPKGRLSAFGQLIAYQFFYNLEYGIRPDMALITDSITPDMTTLFGAFGIRVHIVTPTDTNGIFQACQIVQADCSQVIRLPDVA